MLAACDPQGMNKQTPKGWHSRGYLPHFDDGVRTQFITYRLSDSLPQKVLKKYKLQLENLEIDERELNVKIDKYLDRGIGECHLQKREMAEIVEENLLRFNNEKYKLHAWVIMPNHVHLLLTAMNGYTISQIVHSCKSYTSNKTNKILGRRKRFWFPEAFDRFIRDYDHFEKTLSYIERNPVKAGLCKNQSDWRFSSAWHRKND